MAVELERQGYRLCRRLEEELPLRLGLRQVPRVLGQQQHRRIPLLIWRVCFDDARGCDSVFIGSYAMRRCTNQCRQAELKALSNWKGAVVY